MRSIDERIVDMQFNNKQFESGIADSLQSLENLEKGLRGMDGNAFQGLVSSVETIAEKFTTLGIVGVTALQNITNKAVDAGIELVKSLSVDQITSGFTKYEDKTKSVQTILSALPDLSLEDVNTELEKLLWFTDETSYNFTDMVSNIGKFTASGVDLDVAVTAMQGIANWAAKSGQGTNEASRAMYNLSQAIGMGTVKLQDWKSIENANMATKEFKEIAIDTAKALGTLSENSDVDFTNFSSTLASGWFTSDVLLKSLDRYGNYANEVYQISTELGVTANEAMSYMEDMGIGVGMELGESAFKAAQEAKTLTDAIESVKDAVSTGWMVTFETIIGDYNEARELWTNVANEMWEVFASGAEARNEMLAAWKEMGGRDDLLQAFSNLYEGLKSIINPIKEAFHSIFPPMTAERLFAFTEGLKTIAEKLIISDETADKLRRTFAGLFAAVDITIETFKFFFGVLGEVLGTLTPVGGGILDITAKIGDFIVALRDGANVSDIFTEALEEIGDFLDGVADGIKEAIDRISRYFGQFGGIDLGPLEIFSDRTKVLFKPFTFLVETAEKAFQALKKVFDWLRPYLSTFAAGLGEVFGTIGRVVSNATGIMGFDGLLDLVNTILAGGVLVALKKFLESLKGVTDNAGGVLSNITGILDGVRGSLEAYQSKLKSEAIRNIAIAIGILAAALWVLSTIPMDEMTGALTAITILFTELSAVMLILSKNMGSIKMGGIAAQMLVISTAILILSAACKNLSGLSWEELARGLLGVAVLLASLVGFEKLIGDGKGLMKIGFALIPLSTGLLILSQAVKSLAGMSWEELAKGLLGTGVALLALVGFEKLIGNGKGLMKVGLALIPLATGLLILAKAMKSMAGLSWEELAKGLTGVGGALLVISLLSKVVKPGPLLAMGTAMIGLGAGMAAMAAAMAILGSLSWEGLAKGLIGIAGVLTMLAAASKLISPLTLLAMGAALVGVGAALNLMAAALLIMGQMSWESLAKSLTALAGALTVLAVATKLMSGALAGAAALMAVSLALAVLVPSLVILGMMDLENIGMMLLALVGVFGTFALASLALAPITPVLLALSGAIVLLGVGVLALGVGLGLCAAAITAFAVAGTAGVLAITAMVTSLIGLIPMAIEKIGEGLVLLVGTLIEAVPGILTIVGMLLEGIINLVIEYAPKIMVMLGVLLTEVLALLLEYVPKIVDVALQMIAGILNTIADHIDEIVTAAVSIVIALLKGITENIPKIVDAIFGMLEEIALQIALFIPRLVDLGFTMIIAFLNGMAETIRANVPLMVDAAWNMVEAIIDGICYFFEESGPRLREAMVRVGKALWAGFKGFFGIKSPSTLAEGGAGMIIQGIINGLLGGVTKVVDTIKNVAKSIWNGFKNFFGIKSPSTLMETEGGQVTAGVKKGIEGGQSSLLDSAVNLGKSILNGVKGAVEGIGSVASNVVTTLGDGLKNGLSTVGNAAKNIGGSILGGIKGVLGIKSPAKTMIDAAHETGKGLIVGMKDMMSPVVHAAEDMGSGTVDAMKDSLSKVSDILDSDMELAPTIRPVIDMGDVENGLNSAFAQRQTLNIAGIKRNTSAAYQNESAVPGHSSTDNTDNSQIRIINTFQVRNDSDIQKINRDLGHILSKFNRAKGVPVSG